MREWDDYAWLDGEAERRQLDDIKMEGSGRQR